MVLGQELGDTEVLCAPANPAGTWFVAIVLHAPQRAKSALFALEVCQVA